MAQNDEFNINFTDEEFRILEQIFRNNLKYTWTSDPQPDLFYAFEYVYLIISKINGGWEYLRYNQKKFNLNTSDRILSLISMVMHDYELSNDTPGNIGLRMSTHLFIDAMIRADFLAKYGNESFMEFCQENPTMLL